MTPIVLRLPKRTGELLKSIAPKQEWYLALLWERGSVVESYLMGKSGMVSKELLENGDIIFWMNPVAPVIVVNQDAWKPSFPARHWKGITRGLQVKGSS